MAKRRICKCSSEPAKKSRFRIWGIATTNQVSPLTFSVHLTTCSLPCDECRTPTLPLWPSLSPGRDRSVTISKEVTISWVNHSRECVGLCFQRNKLLTHRTDRGENSSTDNDIGKLNVLRLSAVSQCLLLNTLRSFGFLQNFPHLRSGDSFICANRESVDLLDSNMLIEDPGDLTWIQIFWSVELEVQHKHYRRFYGERLKSLIMIASTPSRGHRIFCLSAPSTWKKFGVSSLRTRNFFSLNALSSPYSPDIVCLYSSPLPSFND